MSKVNEIAIARKAIKKAILDGVIFKESSAMHSYAIAVVRPLVKNDALAATLAWEACKDVIFGC